MFYDIPVVNVFSIGIGKSEYDLVKFLYFSYKSCNSSNVNPVSAI